MKIFTRILCAAALLVAGQQASAQTLLDNFETTRLVNYPVAQGVLTEEVANPFIGGSNTSAKVARFVRSASDAYSTIAIRPRNGKFGDVSAFKSGAQKLTLKFLSPGPGTGVQIVLQNKAKVDLQYPNGNYAGDFFATTTAPANTWETLTFAFTAGNPGGSFDPTVTANDITQIALLISYGTSSGATYYFDDLMGPPIVALPPSGTPPVLLDNFENVRLLSYPVAQGVLTEPFANPNPTAPNTSTGVAKFVRSAADSYATIAIRTNSGKFSDVSAYANGGQKLTMKFLSPGPGTGVQLVFQDNSKVKYPDGNYAGDFFATTKAPANTWETLTFEFQPGTPGATFDPTVKATDIDQIALLIAYGTNSGSTYYFDDLMGPALASTGTAVRSAQNATAAFAAAYPNPTSGLTQLPYTLRKAAVVSLDVFDNLGRRVAQVLDQQRQPAGEFTAELNAARLVPGLYTCRLTVDGVALTHRLSVQ